MPPASKKRLDVDAKALKPCRMTERRNTLKNDTRLIRRWVLACLMSVALVLVGFGHRPVQADQQAVAYLLAGGDWADLCADGDVPHPVGDRCMACILAQSAALPDPVPDMLRASSHRDAHWTTKASSHRIMTGVTPYPARAPPFR
jgi:hypothetical protein